ncbi:MAG TPA: hypothetical protein DHV14_03535 [Micrococcales bacterium]|uniref:DUF4037 domain-containing protein n=1 Tax=Miniimonas arenae TaxID=676201 RepID=UPI000EEAD7AE|nr:DUF4037 domain-containing protein [Miniimonas arenae]HCX84212.1 hypothetical protein [Micrococcales bacterium]
MTGTLDVARVLRDLDSLLAAQAGPERAEAHLRDALAQAMRLGDDPARLTVLNELLGLLRVTSAHEASLAVADEARLLADELADRLGPAGAEARATTLVNVATAQRAAGRTEAALATYREALAAASAAYPPGDRRIAALHNNLSMALGDAGDRAGAVRELRAALALLAAGNGTAPDAEPDGELAATHGNLALALAATGDPADAEEAVRHARLAVATYERLGRTDDPHYAAALAAAAGLDVRAGRYAEAVDGYRTALATVRACFGAQSDAAVVTAGNLAEAEALLARAGAQDEGGTQAGSDAGVGDRRTGRTSRAATHLGAKVRAAADVAVGNVPTGAGSEVGRPAGSAAGEGTGSSTSSPPTRPTPGAGRPAGASSPSPGGVSSVTRGLDLARAYWEAYGRELLAGYPEERGRIAVGLVGHGSECYGFDDEASRDHDFGPGFCLWLTAEDHARIGAALQADYEALPGAFAGFPARADVQTRRAQGAGRRVGVFEIGAFYASLTGYLDAPAVDRPHEWLLLEEATLAAATNGAVFADPFGAFSGVRGRFRRMPNDVRLTLVSRRLGMIAQAGQYNVPRMLARGDGAAAWLAIGELTRATASLVFLLHKPTSVGYLPYYKWQFAALRRLRARLGSRLPATVDHLEEVLRLASAACFPGAAGTTGSTRSTSSTVARERLVAVIEAMCGEIVAELLARGLTRSDAPFLEWQRPYVEELIVDERCRRLA